jgi:diguanylate cyclase (GGDEF)-like protein/PAS domain S-box-containing protein
MTDKFLSLHNSILENLQCLVFILDADGVILYANRIAKTCFSLTLNSAHENCSFSSLVVGSDITIDFDKISNKDMDSVADDSPVLLLKMKKIDGTETTISWTVFTITDDGAEYRYVLTGKDITEHIKREEELLHKNERFRFMLERVDAGILIIDPEELIIIYSNIKASEILGLSRDEIIGEKCDRWGKGFCDRSFIDRIHEHKNIHDFEMQINTHDDKTLHLYINATIVEFRNVEYSLISFVDISEHKKVEEELTVAYRQFEELLSSIVSILIGVSMDDLVTHWNHVAEDTFDIKQKDILNQRFPLCPIDWDWSRVYEGIANSILLNKVIKLHNLDFFKKTGEKGFLELAINPIIDKTHKITGFLILGEDITEKQLNKQLLDEIELRKQAEEELKKANQELERLAKHDPLTDLYNRRYFIEQLELEFKRAKRYNASLAVLIMDLDHFKKVNDTHGHLVGDKVLTSVARSIINSTRSTDIAGRYGGEEFCMILPSTDAQKAFNTAEKLRTAISMNRYHGEFEFTVTCSIGITEIDPDDADLFHLIRRADVALYRAKDAGRNCSVIKKRNP